MVEKQMLTLEKIPLEKRKMFSFQQRYVTIKSVWSDAISIKKERALGNVKKSKIKLIDAIGIKNYKRILIYFKAY